MMMPTLDAHAHLHPARTAGELLTTNAGPRWSQPLILGA